VIDKPPLPFRGEPPDRDVWVLGQAFQFSAEKWRDGLPDPDMWPPELEAAPKSDRREQQVVDRRTVLWIGERATEPLGAVRTLVGAGVWGTGTGARGRYRRGLALIQGVKVIGNPLATAAQKLRADGPPAAYAYLHGDGGNRIKHLGASFDTKFLYFSGYGRYDGAQQQPLILDENVAIALNRLCGFAWRSSGWSTSQYAAYLSLAHDWTVWTWHQRWHLVGGVRDGNRVVGRTRLRAYDLVTPGTDET
jgi:hypothetical protein